jgi:hypothetical protein
MFGATLRCNTVPTSHKRIPVTQDPELEQALERVASYFPAVPPARLVHDLAVRGAQAVVEERQLDDEAIEQLVVFSTERRDLVDWAVLEQVDELAW